MCQNLDRPDPHRGHDGKGFELVADTAAADLAVGYQFTSEEHSSYQTGNTGWTGYGYGG